MTIALFPTTPTMLTNILQSWLNRSMEFLWLLGVFLVPLVFLGQDYAKSETVIAYVEVPKVALLRTIVGLMVVLWLIDWGLRSSVESGTSINLNNLRRLPTRWLAWLGETIWRHPHCWLPIAVGFYLGTTILSTALSGSFRVSLWGEVPGQDSYSAYTVVAYILLFSMIVTRLKTRPQVWRLLGAIVAMGALVSGYAVLQHYGHDLLYLSESTGGMTTSFMGNSIFAAAVIMMTIPITVGASVTSLLRFPRPADTVGSNGSRWAVGLAILGVWVVVLAIQFLGLLFTFSRGPWIGSLCALTLMMVLVAVFVGRRGFVRMALVLGLATIITAAVFFIPRTVDPWTTNEATTSINIVVDPAAAEVVDQFSSIGGEVLGGFSGGRLTHWQVSWQLIKNHPWFAFDSLSLRWLRPLVGYGPDLFRYTYLLKSSAQGPDRSLLAPDHAHNFFVHQTVEQGLLGAMGSLGIFAAALLAGAHQLLRSKNGMDTAHKLILVALLSVVAGRGLEMMVGVARVSDLTVLWVVLGLFAALPSAMKAQELRLRLVDVAESRPRASSGHSVSFSGTGVGRGPWLLKMAVAVCLIGTIFNLTWMNGISYPRAAVKAGHALESYRQGDLPSSLAAIERAVELAPDVPVYHTWKALVFSAYRRDLSGPREQRCSTQGILPYQSCLATLAHQSNLNGSNQRPFYLGSRIALANSAFNLDLDDESIRYRQESLSMVPGSWGLRNNLASALIQQGRPEGALKPLRESLEITEGTRVSIDALIIRARAYVNLGRYQDAIVDLNRALKIKPSSPEAHAGMAVVYANLGQEEKARRASDRAVEFGADRDVMHKAIEEISQGR